MLSLESFFLCISSMCNCMLSERKKEVVNNNNKNRVIPFHSDQNEYIIIYDRMYLFELNVQKIDTAAVFSIFYILSCQKKRRIMMVEKENFSLITNRNYPFGECVSFFGAAFSHSKLVSIYLCERLRFASSQLTFAFTFYCFFFWCVSRTDVRA